jgi:hypothetical protein
MEDNISPRIFPLKNYSVGFSKTLYGEVGLFQNLFGKFNFGSHRGIEHRTLFILKNISSYK